MEAYRRCPKTVLSFGAILLVLVSIVGVSGAAAQAPITSPLPDNEVAIDEEEPVVAPPPPVDAAPSITAPAAARPAAVDRPAAVRTTVAQPAAARPAAAVDGGPLQFGAPPATLAGFPTWLRLSGYVQAQAVLYDRQSVDEIDPSTGEPLNEQRFLIPRAILGLTASRGLFGGRVLFDGNTVNGVTMRLLAADVSFRLPWGSKELPPLAMAIGLMRIPFGQEVQESPQTRLLLETTNTARALFPGNFDLGAMIFGGWRFLRYQLAAMNGNPVNESSQYRGRDPNQSKDFVGHLGLDVTMPRGVRLVSGVSGVVGQGFHPGTPLTKDDLQWRDFNQDGTVQLTELEPISGRAATPSQSFDRFALGGDLRVVVAVPRLGNSTVYGEVVVANNLDRNFLVADPISVGYDLREFGWHVGLTQELTRHALFGIRYDRYNPNRDRTDEVGADVVPAAIDYATLAVAAAWQYQTFARLVLQYEYDRSPFGRDADGSAVAWQNQRLTLRAQLGF